MSSDKYLPPLGRSAREHPAKRGVAGIFSFPFRLHAAPPLHDLLGEAELKGYRYRVHSPLSVNADSTPITSFVPVEQWPDFRWHPRIHPSEQVSPPKAFSPRFLGEATYNALRVDVWGRRPEDELDEFVRRFLEWLRIVSAQPWIGHLESHSDSILKHSFLIDTAGNAVASPFTGGRFTTPEASARPVDASVWSQAFKAAVHGDLPPAYWSLFYDAQVFRTQLRLREAVLSFAVSLEIARDAVFPRFAKTQNRAPLGRVLAKPFNDTNLLEHLTSDLQAVLGRNLQREDPGTFVEIKRLYVARHHIAHGRAALTIGLGGPKLVVDDDLRVWTTAVRACLRWIESLP